MLESGLTVATWGNISARDPETGLIHTHPVASQVFADNIYGKANKDK